MLAPGRRNLHPLCLNGGGGDHWLEGAVGVNNTLYWIRRADNARLEKDHLLFLAYDLNLDMWLEGHLKGSASFFFRNKSICGETDALPFSMWRSRGSASFNLQITMFAVL